MTEDAGDPVRSYAPADLPAQLGVAAAGVRQPGGALRGWAVRGALEDPLDLLPPLRSQRLRS